MVARIAVRIFVLLAVAFVALLTAPSHRPVPAGAGSIPAAPPPPPCGERSPVALNPTAGPAGTQVTATGCGWTPGSQITVTFDNPQTTLATTTVDTGGGFTVSFTMPVNAPPGDHQVLFTQSCPGCVSRQETALFKVTSSPPPPTPTNTLLPTPTPGPPPPPPCNTSMPVTLTPSFGPHGTFVTATGCGWAPGSQVLVSWDNAEPLTSTTVGSDGTFTVSFTVLEDADKGPHQVIFSQGCSGSCAPKVATASFTITEG